MGEARLPPPNPFLYSTPMSLAGQVGALLKARAGFARGYLDRRRDFPVSPWGVAATSLRPPFPFIAPRYIASIGEAGEFLEVRLRGIDRPLFWPRAVARNDLLIVVTETFHPPDWHFYEVPETTVRDGDVVLDCGAAEGAFALRVHSRAGEVIAFEPSPSWRESLRRTFAGSNVTVVEAGVGAAEGVAAFDGAGLQGRLGPSVSDAEHRVPVTTVDAWAMGRRVDYIKADVEGFEMEMLRGAAATISRFKPRLALTVYHPGNDWAEMVTFLRGIAPSYNYRVKGVSLLAGRPQPVMLHAWSD